MSFTCSENSTDQQGRCGATLADDHFTDGKMLLWHCASMFLEDASSLNRSSTFSTICQGYLRWAKQWSSHSHADSGRGPTLGSSTQTISLIPDLCLCQHIVLGSVGFDFGRTLCSNFHFYLYIFTDVLKEITGGMYRSLRWEYWAPSVLLFPDSILSHTPCCVITRGGL